MQPVAEVDRGTIDNDNVDLGVRDTHNFYGILDARVFPETVVWLIRKIAADQQLFKPAMETEPGYRFYRVVGLPHPTYRTPCLLFPVCQRDTAAAITIRLVSGQPAAAQEDFLPALDLEFDR